jgi:putative transcriptional regulator
MKIQESTMSEIGDRLVAAMEDAVAYAKGDKTKGRETVVYVPTVDVKAIREDLNMTQEEFANVYGFAVSAVRNWEQGRRTPDRAARLLLKIIEKKPEVVKDVLQELGRG